MVDDGVAVLGPQQTGGKNHAVEGDVVLAQEVVHLHLGIQQLLNKSSRHVVYKTRNITGRVHCSGRGTHTSLPGSTITE